MDVEDLVESDCPKHGLDRHVCVHEAGHAVAAIDNNVPFRAVVFYDDADAPRFMAGLGQAAAAVDTGPDASAWVLPDPLGSLRFVMGGVAAEMVVLGDSIPGGWSEDIKVWRRGSCRTDQQSEDELAQYIGMPMTQAWQECLDWAEANVPRIEAVADALAGHEPPWKISGADVKAILRNL